jgi:ketosteroid isomerase-like protein
VQRRLFAPVFARVDGLALVCEETIAEGERVVALAGGKGTAKPSGEPYQNRYVFVYRVREGRIVEVSEYLDTALVETALYGKRLVA